jgi:hypothetical protein
MAAPLVGFAPEDQSAARTSMTPICALHNKSQGHFIALQQFAPAIGFSDREVAPYWLTEMLLITTCYVI